jgi:hypothetical protein
MRGVSYMSQNAEISRLKGYKSIGTVLILLNLWNSYLKKHPMSILLIVWEYNLIILIIVSNKF